MRNSYANLKKARNKQKRIIDAQKEKIAQLEEENKRLLDLIKSIDIKKEVDIIQIMTLYYTIWCLLTVCGGWFSVSIISCEGETKETCTF